MEVVKDKMSGLRGARHCPGSGEASDLKSTPDARLREPFTEARFQQLFGGTDPERQPQPQGELGWSRWCGLWRRWARACSWPGAWRLLRARLPPLRWLPRYRWRAWLLGDAVAGVTVGIVHVPQGEPPQHQLAKGASSEKRRAVAGLGTGKPGGRLVWLRVGDRNLRPSCKSVLWGAPSDSPPLAPPSTPHLRNPARSQGRVTAQGSGEGNGSAPQDASGHGSVTFWVL